MRFEDALSIILSHEGGFSNHPADPGGATKWGITRETLTRWRNRGKITRDHVEATVQDVKDLGHEERDAIYRAYFWDAARCSELPEGLRLLVFDAAVNHGVSGAGKMLQRSLKVVPDGVIGPKTVAAARAAEPVELAIEFCAQRADLYETVNETFELGWYRRLFKIFYLSVG